MSIVPADRMTYYRAAAQKSMDMTVVISRRTDVRDRTGGITETWLAVQTTVAEVAPLRGSDVEIIVNEQMRGSNMWWFEFPYNTDIRLTDKCTIAGNPRVYQVGYVADPESYEVMQRVVCTEVE